DRHAEVGERLARADDAEPRLAAGRLRLRRGGAPLGRLHARLRELRLGVLHVGLRAEAVLRRGLYATDRLGLERGELIAGLGERTLALDHLRLLVERRERLEEFRLRTSDVRRVDERQHV